MGSGLATVKKAVDRMGGKFGLSRLAGSNHPSAGRELHGVSSNSFWNAWNVDFADATASP